MTKHLKNYYLFYSFLLFYGLIAVSITQFEEPFDFIRHTMSQLGKPSRNPDFWWLYMIAGVVAGLLLLPFYKSLIVFKNGDPYTDKLLRALIYLGYFSGIALVATATVHADMRLAHKICGGAYFFSLALIVVLASILTYRHPRISNWAFVLLLPSFVLNAMFLYSSGKMAWAEWVTVLLSFLIACYFAFLVLKIRATTDSDSYETTAKTI